jgi:hypothetical protein
MIEVIEEKYDVVPTKVNGDVKRTDILDKNIDCNFDGTRTLAVTLNEKNHSKKLYIKTFNRNNWNEGDLIEIKFSQPNRKSVWYAVEIVEIDYSKNELQITYSKSNLLKFLEENAEHNDDYLSVDSSCTDFEDDSESCIMFGDTILQSYKILDINIRPMYVHFNTTVSTPNSEDQNINGTTDVAGASGLKNLGNTCFMNSILQCVSNTQCITELFTSDKYKNELNLDNPLGHGGKLATAYGELLKDIWSGVYSCVAPRKFKNTIAECNTQFAGYDQQDSQEFLGFLLDGLHVRQLKCYVYENIFIFRS